jgi:hypothetical protein
MDNGKVNNILSDEFEKFTLLSSGIGKVVVVVRISAPGLRDAAKRVTAA